MISGVEPDVKATVCRSAHLLVVDDEAAIRQLLVVLLTAEGYEVQAAGSGEEALAAVRNEKPDAMLLDINLPGMDGFEVLESLRRDFTMYDLPVVVVTGHAEEETRLHALVVGANEILGKPIHRAELVARLKSLLALRRTHVELEERLEELRRLAELKDFLANTLVHDMRTPMTAALGSLGMMEHELNVGGQRVREYLERAQTAMTNVINMATDVIELARLEDSQSFAKLVAMDVVPIVRERTRALEDAARMRGQVFLIHADDESMEARLDRHLTGRVLDNLLMNAIHHGPSGSSIEMAIKRGSEGDILVSVQNGGLGIPREYHQKIFEKYGQIEVHRNGVNAGVGLGLAFCRLAVQAQGGRIWVESEGSLTRFCFALPDGRLGTLTGTVA